MDGWLTNKIAPRTWQHKKYQDINMWHSYEDVIWRHCWGRPRYSSTIRQSALTAGLTPTDDITALVFNIMKKNSPRKNEIIGMPECSVPRTRCHNTARCLMYILTASERNYVRDFQESVVVIPTLYWHCGLTVDLQTVTMVMDDTSISLAPSPFFLIVL